MLHLFPAELPHNKSEAIRKWLGAAPARDLVEFLTLKDAEATAQAANKFIDPETHEPM